MALSTLSNNSSHQNQVPKSPYTFLNVISSGSYGVVYRGQDNATGEIVAIKHEVHGMSQSTMREIGMLSCLPPHPSIVHYKGLYREEDHDRDRVFVVMEYLPTDLRGLMQVNAGPLTLLEVKLIMRQILEGVDFLHQFDVMHRDIKPDNILVDAGTPARLKICDFGMSRIFERGSGSFTPGVCTLWYRAPEILIGQETYTKAVDMWSVGCIMAELVAGEVLFPGDSEIGQIRLVWNTTRNMICRKLGEAALLRKAPVLTDCGYDLLLGLLNVNPESRISAEDAVCHNWFNESYSLSS